MKALPHMEIRYSIPRDPSDGVIMAYRRRIAHLVLGDIHILLPYIPAAWIKSYLMPLIHTVLRQNENLIELKVNYQDLRDAYESETCPYGHEGTAQVTPQGQLWIHELRLEEAE